MDHEFNKHVFLINNSLEAMSEFVFEEEDVIFHNIKFEELEDILKNNTFELNRRNLVIVSSMFFSSNENINSVNELFEKCCNIKRPYRIIICFNELSEQEKKEYIEKGIFYFFVENIELMKCEYFISNFKEFILLVFRKVISNERIDDYITKTFQIVSDSHIITKQKREIEKLYDELETMSMFDHLTRLLNRKAFFDALECEIKRTIRDRIRIGQIEKIITQTTENDYAKQILENIGIFSCLMLDLDFFKNVNDTYGHLVGDKVLKKIGEILLSKEILRGNDIVGRYGGEEFIAILPNTNSRDAFTPAERLRLKIQNTDFFDDEDNPFSLTVTIGISEYQQTDKTPSDIIYRADKALYFGKKNGKNQTVLYDSIYQ